MTDGWTSSIHKLKLLSGQKAELQV